MAESDAEHRQGTDAVAPRPAVVEHPDRLLGYLMETVSVVDRAGRLLYSTYRRDPLTGHPEGFALDGGHPIDLVHPYDRPRVLELLAECLATPGAVVSGEFQMRAADDTYQWVEGLAHNRIDDAAIGAIVLVTRNVTKRVEALHTAQVSESRFRALVAHSATIAAMLDEHGRFVYASPAASDVLGRALDEVVERIALHDLVIADDRGSLTDAFAEVVAVPGITKKISIRVARPDDDVRHLEATLTNLLDDPAVGAVVANVLDVTERVQFVDALRHQALHDPLTGLPNRALLIDRIEHALTRARRDGGPIALCFLDLDRFKVVNDSLGHAAGDRLLVEIAARLRSVVRDTDTVARLGGDEFVVLADGATSRNDAVALAQRLLNAIEAPFATIGGELAPSASIGVVVTDGHTDAADILRDADAAMYVAKDEGRARLRVFDERIAERTHNRLHEENALRRALERHELALEYQPVIDLHSNSIEAVEALLRWDHPERGRLVAAQFVPLAEDAGLVEAIGAFVLDEACRQAAAWPVPIRTWINLAPRQFTDRALVRNVGRALERHQLRAERIGIEVTEGAIVGEANAFITGTSALARHGVALALDDFGTGYSSLAHLHQFPVQVVKIDKSFTWRLGDTTRSEEIVSAVVAMAHALNLRVIAEGVETDEQLELVRALGCDAAQGFLLGRPAPPEQIADRLLRRSA